MFKFNFTSQELDIDETENQNLETSLNDLSLEESSTDKKIPAREYDISSTGLPNVIQGDVIQLPSLSRPLYKRMLDDVKFQMAQQDTFDEDNDNACSKVVSMLNLSGNSDLVRGVYEGGFKTWECSLDLVEFLAQLPSHEICDKKILELGCGSALPSLYLLSRDEKNRVDVQDYNEEAIRYITIPNILLNTVLSVQDSTSTDLVEDTGDMEDSESSSEEEEDEDEAPEEKDQIIGESSECDVEAEINSEKVPEMLARVSERTRAFVGDWSNLPTQLNVPEMADKYDTIVTSETIYNEHALPDLVRVFQYALKKPSGVA
ncbi:uncharacterized protein BYT42DRAFT_504172 [Radiomyces spectabilis]|uniref:uncharacterized protein n=1 Tax=Radiomyces spectabilis TaxID=64574 RepID=UPI00221F2DD8|nr:uncharacterized protein BYT42DRAFT_504172 [Radiomyces spectabilis]KAI8367615.1 hypothetical protein BYT42DRAFT_504172 [Radiomyces spectabilis]